MGWPSSRSMPAYWASLGHGGAAADLEGEEIGDGDGAAFFLRGRDVLDEGVDWDDEESADGADEGEERGDGYEAYREEPGIDEEHGGEHP